VVENRELGCEARCFLFPMKHQRTRHDHKCRRR
jgi:hypothetical protein